MCEKEGNDHGCCCCCGSYVGVIFFGILSALAFIGDIINLMKVAAWDVEDDCKATCTTDAQGNVTCTPSDAVEACKDFFGQVKGYAMTA